MLYFFFRKKKNIGSFLCKLLFLIYLLGSWVVHNTYNILYSVTFQRGLYLKEVHTIFIQAPLLDSRDSQVFCRIIMGFIPGTFPQSSNVVHMCLWASNILAFAIVCLHFKRVFRCSNQPSGQIELLITSSTQSWILQSESRSYSLGGVLQATILN